MNNTHCTGPCFWASHPSPLGQVLCGPKPWLILVLPWIHASLNDHSLFPGFHSSGPLSCLLCWLLFWVAEAFRAPSLVLLSLLWTLSWSHLRPWLLLSQGQTLLWEPKHGAYFPPSVATSYISQASQGELLILPFPHQNLALFQASPSGKMAPPFTCVLSRNSGHENLVLLTCGPGLTEAALVKATSTQEPYSWVQPRNLKSALK